MGNSPGMCASPGWFPFAAAKSFSNASLMVLSKFGDSVPPCPPSDKDEPRDGGFRRLSKLAPLLGVRARAFSPVDGSLSRAARVSEVVESNADCCIVASEGVLTPDALCDPRREPTLYLASFDCVPIRMCGAASYAASGSMFEAAGVLDIMIWSERDILRCGARYCEPVSGVAAPEWTTDARLGCTTVTESVESLTSFDVKPEDVPSPGAGKYGER